MPEIVAASIEGKRYVFLNADFSVGTGGSNMTGDVMLVQALLNYVAPLIHLGGHQDHFEAPPRVDGNYDDETGLAIVAYQLHYGHRITKADGRIDAPSYAARKIGFTGKRVMTMTMLQMQAHSAQSLWAHDHWIKGIHSLWHDLFPWIRLT